MAKIKEVVSLKTGYANFVKLKSDFENREENAAGMAMYRHTKAHRKAFERICKGLYNPNLDKPEQNVTNIQRQGFSCLRSSANNNSCRTSFGEASL